MERSPNLEISATVVKIQVLMISMCSCMISCFSCLLFAILRTGACQAPLSMGFSSQKPWRGLPSPPPGYTTGLSQIMSMYSMYRDFPAGTSGKGPTRQCRRCKRHGPSLGQEDSLEEGMATHFSILAWRIPWTEKPGGLQLMGSQRTGHD